MLRTRMRRMRDSIPLAEVEHIMPAKKTSKKKTFQERMEFLEEIVESLEDGELDLEDAISRFEEGRKLEKELLAELASYEKRLDKLLADGDLKSMTTDAPEDS